MTIWSGTCIELDLSADEIGKIHWVEAIADLEAHAPVSDEAQWVAVQISMHPVSDDTLVGSAELPCPGHQSASVDPEWKAEGVRVFSREPLRC
jgi:hypothetical protein